MRLSNLIYSIIVISMLNKQVSKEKTNAYKFNSHLTHDYWDFDVTTFSMYLPKTFVLNRMWYKINF